MSLPCIDPEMMPTNGKRVTPQDKCHFCDYEDAMNQLVGAINNIVTDKFLVNYNRDLLAACTKFDDIASSLEELTTCHQDLDLHKPWTIYRQVKSKHIILTK